MEEKHLVTSMLTTQQWLKILAGQLKTFLCVVHSFCYYVKLPGCLLLLIWTKKKPKPADNGGLIKRDHVTPLTDRLCLFIRSFISLLVCLFVAAVAVHGAGRRRTPARRPPRSWKTSRARRYPSRSRRPAAAAVAAERPVRRWNRRWSKDLH